MDPHFLYLLAFSLKLQNLTLQALAQLVSRFESKPRLCSKVFFFFFRRFIEHEKHAQSETRDFDLKQFENAAFMDCLALVSELIVGQILHPNRFANQTFPALLARHFGFADSLVLPQLSRASGFPSFSTQIQAYLLFI